MLAASERHDFKCVEHAEIIGVVREQPAHAAHVKQRDAFSVENAFRPSCKSVIHLSQRSMVSSFEVSQTGTTSVLNSRSHLVLFCRVNDLPLVQEMRSECHDLLSGLHSAGHDNFLFPD